MAAAAAAVIVRKEKEIVNIFRGAGALSAERARDPEQLGVHQHLAFHRLVQRAVLRDAGDGRFYLDEMSWNALRNTRRRIAILALAVVAAAFVVLLLSGALVSRS